MHFKLKDELKKIYANSFLLRGQIVGLIVGTFLFFFSYFMINYRVQLRLDYNFFTKILGWIYIFLTDNFIVFHLTDTSFRSLPVGNVIAFILVHMIEFMIIFMIIHLIEKKVGKLKFLPKIGLIILFFLILRVIFFFIISHIIILIVYGGLNV